MKKHLRLSASMSFDKPIVLLLALEMVSAALFACSRSQPETPAPLSPTVTSQPSSTPRLVTSISTPTKTPSPTSTSPPPTSTPPPSPTVAPTKQLFLAYYDNPGDGGIEPYDAFLGTYRHTNLLIYTDGQVLREEGDWFIEWHISDAEMCKIYSRLEDNGFFREDPRQYNSTPWPQDGFPEGGPSSTLAVSGNPITRHTTSPQDSYLVYNFSTAFDFISTYRPNTTYHDYQSDRLLMWIEQFSENSLATPEIAWPDWSFGTSLAGLLAGQKQGFVFTQGEKAPSLGRLPGIHLFTEADNQYVILSRPLLPHESPEQLSSGFSLSEPPPLPIAPLSEIPFRCEK